MTIGQIDVFTRMRRRIEAEESLIEAERIAVAVRTMDRKDAARVIERWERAIEAKDSTKPRRKSAPLDAAAMARMGIRVITEVPPTSSEG